ncbi:hypothetical protein HDU97_006127 [Phlyctochytrium planicorne]|nr:hypothetical protein HDU97_006127 [Phlyctochytrium planicorne]
MLATSIEAAAPAYDIVDGNVDSGEEEQLPFYTPAASLWSPYAHRTLIQSSKALFDASGAYIYPIAFDSAALPELKMAHDLETPEAVKALRDEYVDSVQRIRKLKPAQERYDEISKRIKELNIQLLDEMQELEELKGKEEKGAKKVSKIESGKSILSFTAKITGNLEKLKMKENATKLQEAVSDQETVVAGKKEELKDKRDELERLEEGPLKQLETAKLDLLRTIAKPFSSTSSEPILTLDANHTSYLESQLLPLQNAMKRDLAAHIQAHSSAGAFLAHVKHAHKIFYAAWTGAREYTDAPGKSSRIVGTGQAKKILMVYARPSIAEAERCVGGIYKKIVDFVPGGPAKVKDVKEFLDDPFKKVDPASGIPPSNALMMSNDRLETIMKVTEKKILPSLAKQTESIEKAMGPVAAAAEATKNDILKFRLSLFDGVAGADWKAVEAHELEELAAAWN